MLRWKSFNCLGHTLHFYNIQKLIYTVTCKALSNYSLSFSIHCTERLTQYLHLISQSIHFQVFFLSIWMQYFCIWKKITWRVILSKMLTFICALLKLFRRKYSTVICLWSSLVHEKSQRSTYKPCWQTDGLFWPMLLNIIAKDQKRSGTTFHLMCLSETTAGWPGCKCWGETGLALNIHFSAF